MVTTTGTIKAGTFVGPGLEHYIVTAGGPNFTIAENAQAIFGIIIGDIGGPADKPAGELALIGELKTTGHATNGQKFALVAGSGWTAASLSSALGCTVSDNIY